MATIDPVSAMSEGVQTVTWTGITTTTDTPTAFGPMNRGIGARRASVTISGTFDSTTGVLQGSNDGVVYATLTDLAGNAISATAAKIQEFSSSVLYLKPGVSGGGTDNLDFVVVMRA